MAKWASRMALGLSNSIPGVQLDVVNIKEIPDISAFIPAAAAADPSSTSLNFLVSPNFSGKGKPPSEMEMTDGCGFINLYALHLLYKKDIWMNAR